jgi:hypothetical protein
MSVIHSPLYFRLQLLINDIDQKKGNPKTIPSGYLKAKSLVTQIPDYSRFYQAVYQGNFAIMAATLSKIDVTTFNQLTAGLVKVFFEKVNASQPLNGTDFKHKTIVLQTILSQNLGEPKK